MWKTKNCVDLHFNYEKNSKQDMKKAFSLIVSLLIVAGMAQAQTRWGVVAGTGISKLKFNQKDLVESKNIMSMTVGLIGEYMIPGIGFGVDAALMYNMAGANVDLSKKQVWSSLGYGVENLRLHYLDLPLNLRFRYRNLNGVENIIAPIVYAGPTFSILVGKNKAEPFRCNSTDLSVHVGFGAELYQKVQVTCEFSWDTGHVVSTKLLDEFMARKNEVKFKVAYMF